MTEQSAPRYPVTDLGEIEKRIAQRREYTERMPACVTREVVEGDTEIMSSLVLEVKNLRLANEKLKKVIDAIGKRGAP